MTELIIYSRRCWLGKKIYSRFAIGDKVYFSNGRGYYEGEVTGAIIERDGVTLYIISDNAKEYQFDKYGIYKTPEQLLNSQDSDTISLHCLDGSVQVLKKDKRPNRYKVGDKVRRVDRDRYEVWEVIDVKVDDTKGCLYKILGINTMSNVKECDLCFEYENPHAKRNKS